MLRDREGVASRGERISRKNLVSSLTIGFLIGIVAGFPIGWFSHRVYFRYHSAQVLLCRQQHFGQTEAQLVETCGALY